METQLKFKVLIILCFSHSSMEANTDAIIKFSRTMRWTRISFGASFHMKTELSEIYKRASESGISVSVCNEDCSSNNPVVLPFTTDVAYVASLLEGHKNNFNLVLIGSESEWQDLKEKLLKKTNLVWAIYCLIIREIETNYMTVLKLSPTEDLITETVISSPDYPIFDLKGVTLTSATLNWKPWLEIDSCIDTLKYCETSGILPDILNLLGSIYNFTWTVDREPSGNWGTMPKEGTWQAENLTFIGLMGSVFRGDYQMGLSYWDNSQRRMDFFDLSYPIIAMPISIIMDFKQGSMDSTLFVRVFTMESWAVGIIVLSAVLILHLMIEKLQKSSRQVNNLVCLSGWLCFTLLHAYYGGALTMFFTMTSDLPFQSVEEGLSLYPKFDFIVQKGGEHPYLQMAKEGIPPFVKFAERVQEHEDNYLLPMSEVLRRMSEEMVFTEANIFNFMSSFNQEQGLDLDPVFRRSRTGYGSFLLRKSSPWGKILRHGLTRIEEKGIISKILRSYLGAGRKRQQNAHSLGSTEMAIAFIAYSCLLATVWIIFILEMLLKYLHKVQSREKQ